MKPQRTPHSPTMPQRGPTASLSAPTTLFWVFRPMRSSAIMIGRPTAAMQIR